MEEIDQKLDQWIHNSIIRAEIRESIVKAIHTHAKTVLSWDPLDVKVEAYKAGWIKCELNYKQNTNKDG